MEFWKIRELLLVNNDKREFDVQGILYSMWKVIDQYWTELAIMKDPNSACFFKRSIPTDYNPKTLTVEEVTLFKVKETFHKKTAGGLTPLTRREIIRLKKATYGLESLKCCEIEEVQNSILAQSNYNLIRSDLVEWIFQKLSSNMWIKTLYLAWCTLACDPRYCHLALIPNVLRIVFWSQWSNNWFKQPYTDVLKKSMFQCLYILNNEETLIGSRTTSHHRYILDVEVIQLLPHFNNTLHDNPYITSTLSNSEIKSVVYDNEKKEKEKQYIDRIEGQWDAYSNYSILNRFHVFTDEIFRGLPDQIAEHVYFTGSGLSACIIKNPLEKKFGIDFNEDPTKDKGWSEAQSDQYWKNNIYKLQNYFDEYYPSKRVVNGLDKLTPDNFLKIEDVLSDIDIQIPVMEDSLFDEIVYGIFHSIKKQLARKYSKLDVNLLKINYPKGPSYKYYISGLSMMRTVEIYRPWYGNPIGGPVKYHFPIVRASMNMDKIYCATSLACCAKTGVVYDYRWFTIGNNGNEIIFKYMTRGFYFILNNYEKLQIANYVKNSSYNHILSHRDISYNHPIYEPRNGKVAYYCELLKFCVSITSIEYTYCNYRFPKEKKHIDKDRRLKDKTIKSKNGYILPLKMHYMAKILF